jgi:hypothetical protein
MHYCNGIKYMIILLYKNSIAKKAEEGYDKMQLNRGIFLEFIQDNFHGNMYKCANALNMSPSTVWRVANGYSKAGMKFLTNLRQYCIANNKLDYEGIIFFE